MPLFSYMRKQYEKPRTFPGLGTRRTLTRMAWPGAAQSKESPLTATPLAAQNSIGCSPAPGPLPLPRSLPLQLPNPGPASKESRAWRTAGTRYAGGEGHVARVDGKKALTGYGVGTGSVGGVGARGREGGTFLLTHTQAPKQLS
jgi:hypothetical protein